MQIRARNGKLDTMTAKSSGLATGYTRREFGALFQIYSSNVYSGFFRDFRFGEARGCYQMAFAEDATKPPLITIEKRRLGPDKALFVALSPNARGVPMEIARSEKIEPFTAQLRGWIDRIKAERTGRHGNVTSIYA